MVFSETKSGEEAPDGDSPPKKHIEGIAADLRDSAWDERC